MTKLDCLNQLFLQNLNTRALLHALTMT